MSALKTLFVVVLVSLWASIAAAQPHASGGINYDVWNDLASLAETTVDELSETTESYERLRARIVTFRTQFAEARDANRDRIANVRAQLDALGPVPESGIEAEDIASRRADLEGQLKALEAPGLVADAAFRRADGLIGEIDLILRNRQAKRLLALGPTPLNPVHWAPALRETWDVLTRIERDSKAEWSAEQSRNLRENAPVVVFLIAVGALLLVRGRQWAGMALKRLRSIGGQGTGVWRFLVSLFRIFLPLLGLYAIVVGIEISGIAGPKLHALLVELPVFGAILLGFRWLAERLFARDDDDALIPLDSSARSATRSLFLILSLLFVLRGLMDLVLNMGDTSPATEPVMAFPIIVLMGITLFRLGQLFKSCQAAQEEGNDEEVVTRGTGLAAAVRWTGKVMMAVAVIGPVMAAVGFSEAGNALLFPTIASLLLLGLVVALQRFAADVYVLATGQGPEARDALVPALLGFVLLLLAAPLMLLAWGMRPAELKELWTRFGEGFQIGATRISPYDFMTFALIFVAGYTLTRLLQGALRSNVLPKTKIDVGGQTAILAGLGYVGIFLSAVVAITTVGIDLSSIAIVAGALSVGIGFGLQTIVSNFISGIILLIERPISEGDWIEVGGQQGYVRNISVRSTRIETFDRSDVIVPNADLISGTVTNFTRGNTVGRLIVSVGVAYGTDTRRVEKILQEIAAEQTMVLRNPPPMVLFDAFGADALEFQIRMILRDVNWMIVVKNEINHAIAKRFAEEKIEVPFAQRDLWLRNPEVLKGGST